MIFKLLLFEITKRIVKIGTFVVLTTPTIIRNLYLCSDYHQPPMSRSYHHSPVQGYTKKESEKLDKQQAQRKVRRRNAAMLQQNVDEEELFFLHRELSNVWSFAKDGKRWRTNLPTSAMRK